MALGTSTGIKCKLDSPFKSLAILLHWLVAPPFARFPCLYKGGTERQQVWSWCFCFYVSISLFNLVLQHVLTCRKRPEICPPKIFRSVLNTLKYSRWGLVELLVFLEAALGLPIILLLGVWGGTCPRGQDLPSVSVALCTEALGSAQPRSSSCDAVPAFLGSFRRKSAPKYCASLPLERCSILLSHSIDR